ncbi:hypothetical protein MUK42_07804 [Musa troglodytarum]|uniref:Serine-threonine kinase receptor-associated protein n=1 Tax=Musa troglodytarum TaxID=320322 RepID=A0A9E7ESD3_9LILI|nr:hypothetical protein MUK42_07804 [Musa troglodytarum]
MRPILMKGHERPLTFLKYNREGDLLFSFAKDHTPTVWFADSGERLGTYRGHNGAVWCCDVSQTSESVLTIKGPQARINRVVWGPLNKTIISAGEDAVIRVWDTETGQVLKESDKETGHQKTISSLSKSADDSHFLTGSLDKSAKVVIGGGQEAVHVTTTDRRAGKFEAKFFHKILQEEIEGVKGHFGPINALDFNPDGRRLVFHLIFSSGGEDGYVRLHHFDPDYFSIKM